MSDFRVRTSQAGSVTLHHLQDAQSGAEATVSAGYGFNLFDLKLPIGGRVRPILYAAEGFAASPRDPARNGIPILFPFPNRIAGGRYTFGGKTYQLPINLKPNAIHGFVMDTPWEVTAFEAMPQGARISGRHILSQQAPASLPLWPSDAVLEVTYTLAGRMLRMDIAVTNPTAHDLPYGFGIHPYFHLPLDPDSDNARTKVIIPASKRWVLKEFLPTGEVEPVPSELDFRQGKPMKGLTLDDVFTGLEPEGQPQRRVCRLVDETLNAEVQLSFGPEFRELVAYTPPGDGRIISLEPYTQTTDAINLQARGIDAGLRVLKHGERDELVIEFSTVDL
jgi:aldose 1-epimerase